MISELDPVVLTRAFLEHGLGAGDVGTVVHVYGAGKAYEVELVKASGETIAVLTLTAKDVRPMDRHQILHVRSLAPV